MRKLLLTLSDLKDLWVEIPLITYVLSKLSCLLIFRSQGPWRNKTKLLISCVSSLYALANKSPILLNHGSFLKKTLMVKTSIKTKFWLLHILKLPFLFFIAWVWRNMSGTVWIPHLSWHYLHVKTKSENTSTYVYQQPIIVECCFGLHDIHHKLNW